MREKRIVREECKQLLVDDQSHECAFMYSSVSNVIFWSNTQILPQETLFPMERNAI